MTSRAIIITGGFGILGTAVASAFRGCGDDVAQIDFAPAAAAEVDAA